MNKKIDMTKLADLTGEHLLDAVDFSTETSTLYDRDCQVVCFRLDDIIYVAKEDPDDGYRSHMEELSVAPIDVKMKNTFPSVQVIGVYQGDSSDILELIDSQTGEVVLEIGTDKTDDYYPYFVSSFHPEAMITNKEMKIDINKKYRTRDGHQVRLLCVDHKVMGDKRIIGLVEIENNEILMTWDKYGKDDNNSKIHDLVEVQPYEDFKINDEVLVRCVDDIENDSWVKRHFAGVDEYGRPMVFKYGMTSWTTSEVTVWDECVKANNECD